jgi:hypothetical protein
MTRLEKCELLKSKGFTYNPETGKIYGTSGKEITNKRNDNYIQLKIKKDKIYFLLAHHYAWYWVYGNVEFEMLDHINRDKSDNRICNLRIVNNSLNSQNQDVKGYCWDKSRNKWVSRISIEGNNINLGRYDTEEEARQAYLSAKLKYHPGFTHLNQ